MKTVLKTPDVAAAKSLAEDMHAGQTRADGVTPYIEHPKMVAQLVASFGGSDEAIALAWLHDILEESGERFKKHFGIDAQIDDKVSFVREMKDRLDFHFLHGLVNLSDQWDSTQFFIEKRGKVSHLAELLISANSDVLLVKLCDILANTIESDGKRSTQEKRYKKAIEILKMVGRKDLEESHKKAIAYFDSVYGLHKLLKKHV